MKYSAEDKALALTTLKTCYKPGDVVWCIQRSRSRSGMASNITPVAATAEARCVGLAWPTWAVAVALEKTIQRTGAYDTVRMTGTGYSKPDALADAIARFMGMKEGQLKGEWL